MLIRARAPLRLSFGGGGTELSPYLERYGGQVLNATINWHGYAILEPADNGKVRFIAADCGKVIEFEVGEEIPLGPGVALPLHRGVYNRIVRDYHGGKPLSLTLTTFSDAPVGSGLGASSTMTVAMIKAFDEYLGLALGEYEVAHLGFYIERIDLGLSGGRQDHYSASFGGFNFMEFSANDHVLVNPLRVRNWIVSELEASMLLYYTGTSRESANIIEDQRFRMEAQNDPIIEHLHQIKKYAVVMKEHLLKGELGSFARVLDLSWMEKKQTSNKISGDHIDNIYAMTKTAGVIGGKVSGAGGGGFMMLICDPSSIVCVRERLQQTSGFVTNCRFVHEGAQSWRI